jgi:hypothetical protein
LGGAVGRLDRQRVPKFSGSSRPRAPNTGAVSSFGGAISSFGSAVSRFGSAVNRLGRQRVPRFGGSSRQRVPKFGGSSR